MSRTEVAEAACEALFGSVEAIDDVSQVSSDEAQSVPDWWLELVAVPQQESIQRVLAQWNEAFSGKLPTYISGLKKYCTDIFLVRIRSDRFTGLALLYRMDVPDKGVKFLIGYPPTKSVDNSLAARPPLLKEFHSSLHDGIGEFFDCRAPGLFGSNELITWESWVGEPIAYLMAPPVPSLIPSDIYLFYYDGAGGYITFNTDQNVSGVWCVVNGVFEEDSNGSRDLWDVLDAWWSFFFGFTNKSPSEE